MAFFITFLRAVAACLITNSHYTGIYPTDMLASGGLIGDILFFAVSGWCLYSIRSSFFPWYGRRLLRIYPSVIIASAVYLLVGRYFLSGRSLWQFFVYPTEYRFIASIIVLYIPYYFILKVEKLRRNIPWVMLAIAVVYLLIYCCCYDRSTYHIDNVGEPMIRFLFGESMLLGAWFRRKDDKFRNAFQWWLIPANVILLVAYFVSKVLFTRMQEIAQLQIINQILIFALLYFLFRLFVGLDSKFTAICPAIKKVIEFIAKLTLEIYVVQNVLITVLRPLFGFPVNWLVITASIIAAAFVLHVVSSGVIKGVEKLCARGKAWQEK